MEIKGLVAGITKELWGVISLYDPQKSKKVKFSEGRQYDLLRESRENIRYAGEDETDLELELKLDIIERTLNSLAKSIDSLKGQMALQEFDIESTKIFFRDSAKVSTLKDSYIDEMESLMERIRIIDEIIQRNVDDYTARGFEVMRQVNQRIKRDLRQWAVIEGFGILIISVLASVLCILRH